MYTTKEPPTRGGPNEGGKALSFGTFTECPIFIFCILFQLHLPVQLPCFSFTTIANSYLGVSMYSTVRYYELNRFLTFN